MGRIRHASSVFVISDLHLGGIAPAMMGRPALLASFIDGLPARIDGAAAPSLELVIAGDFVDFLAAPPDASFTPDPRAACDKLGAVVTGSPFAPVFDALGRHVAAGHRLTVLLGNHDVELALPQVQAALLDRIDAAPHEVLWLTDGRAYRVGGALIEHGNRYDDANANDWTGLRAIASALSRDEAPADKLRVSAGSEIVHRVVNPLKVKYPFVDLLQPQGEVVALLLLAFEPSLKWQWDKLASLLQGARLEAKNALGMVPGETRHVGFHALEEEARPRLQEAFREAYDELRQPSELVGVRDWLSVLFTPKDDGLSALFDRGAEVPAKRLGQIRTVMRELLLDDASDRLDGPAGQYGEAAKRLIAQGTGIEAVVMGHTHLPRRIEMGAGVYLNTGTWVDRFRVPAAAMAEGGDEALEAWLKALWRGERTALPATYGELRIDEAGHVTVAAVREAEAT